MGAQFVCNPWILEKLFAILRWKSYHAEEFEDYGGLTLEFSLSVFEGDQMLASLVAVVVLAWVVLPGLVKMGLIIAEVEGQ